MLFTKITDNCVDIPTYYLPQVIEITTDGQLTRISMIVAALVIRK